MKNKLIVILTLVAPLLNAQSPTKSPETNIEHTVLQKDALLINVLFEKGYNKWNKDSLVNIMLPAVWKEQDSIVATYPTELKAIRYYYANKLFKFSDGIKYNMSKKAAWKIIADTSFCQVSMPDTSLLSSSVSANLYVDNFMTNKLMTLFLDARENGELIIQQKLDLPIDSLKKIAVKYGETFLTILYAPKILSPVLHEHYLSNQLSNKVENKDLMTSIAIYRELKKFHPHSQWLAVYEKKLNQLDSTQKQNKDDKSIVFIHDTDSITSLQKLVAPFKGKVVYLDIWGSWCGPCINEIAYHTKPLKKHFENEDQLVYLYLAMERPESVDKWRELILLHGIKGYHLNKSEKAIEPFWQDLLGTSNVARRYPTYAIFNKEGKLLTADAYRPSQTEALYQQLKEALK